MKAKQTCASPEWKTQSILIKILFIFFLPVFAFSGNGRAQKGEEENLLPRGKPGPSIGEQRRAFTTFQEAGDFQRSFLEAEKLTAYMTGLSDSVTKNSLRRLVYMETLVPPQDMVLDLNISALCVDGDDLWLGSRSGDIARYSLSERNWTSYVKGKASLAIRSVQCILGERDVLWFLSYGAVSLYSKRFDRFFSVKIPDDREYRGLQSAMIMGKGLIVGVQGQGLRRITLDSHTFIDQNPPLENITYLKKWPDGMVLAGSENQGLYLLDSHYKGKALVGNPKETAAVRSILGPRDNLIAGSYGQGLFQLKKRRGGYAMKLLPSQSRWITAGVELKNCYCFSTLGEGLLTMNKTSGILKYYGIEAGLGGLDISTLVYVKPYVICAVQGQGLVKIHEDYFSAP